MRYWTRTLFLRLVRILVLRVHIASIYEKSRNSFVRYLTEQF